MNKIEKRIIRSIVIFIITYLIVGFVKNGMFVGIKWSESATIWDMLREFYLRTAFINSIVSFTLILIIIALAYLFRKLG